MPNGGSDCCGTCWFNAKNIRQHLIALLGRMKEQPSYEYPIGIYADELVVWQLGEFRESRAVELLRSVASFDPNSAEVGPFGRTREDLVRLAQEALGKIERDATQPGASHHPITLDE